MKRTLVAVALVIVFVMALAAPAFAITHSATYQMDGVINFKKQMGHWCNTGAEIKQTIMGSGQMDKVQTVSMVAGKITMKDANDGVAGATPLTVTTVWELCAPPKAVYNDNTYGDASVSWSNLYARTSADKFNGFAAGSFVPTGGGQLSPWEAIAAYPATEGITEQIWAVQVQADPGYSINVHQDGVAAHGNGVIGAIAGDIEDYSWTTLDRSNKWGWGADSDGNTQVVVGPDYVGNYFTMDQHARTSMGTLKRYIDISSPFTGAYLHEDMSVVGKSDVKEAFAMVNLPAGADVPGDWWKLF